MLVSKTTCTRKIVGSVIGVYETEAKQAASHPLIVELRPSLPHVPFSYIHLRVHETVLALVCRLLLEKKNVINMHIIYDLLSKHLA